MSDKEMTWWMRLLFAATLILFVMIFGSIAKGEDATDFVLPDGHLDVKALTAYLNDPNKVVPEIAEEETAVKVAMPFIEQWLEKATEVVTTMPKTTSDNQTGAGIIWEFNAGNWQPVIKAKAGYIGSTIQYYNFIDIYYMDGATKHHVTITGEKLLLRDAVTTPPSCDRNGDNKIDLKDFAHWAKDWKK